MPNIEIKALSPDTRQDFLRFMEGEAFADNPKWAFCYCQYAYVDHKQVNWEARTADENRDAACERMAAGTMRGYLAYRDAVPVGWCNAVPRNLLPAYIDSTDPESDRIGQITCFVVAKDYRRSGVATALLAAACDGLQAEGFTIAEATPFTKAKSDAQHHYGPLQMYLDAGFSVHCECEDGRVIVRRPLMEVL